MKRKIFMLLGLIYFDTALGSQAVIYNMSSQHDMDVTYQICLSEDQKKDICTDSKTTLIKSKKFSNEKNYTVLTSPWQPVKPSTYIEINIISANEKDSVGNIISQATFSTPEDNGTCGGTFDGIYQNGTIFKRNQGIILDDMNQSPNILCISNSSVIYFNNIK